MYIFYVYFIPDQTSITSVTLNSDSPVSTVDELTAMTLRCDVDSNPGSTITLLNNSMILRQMTKSKQAEYTWNEAGCLDTGQYICKADNGIKQAVSKSAKLVVRCMLFIYICRHSNTISFWNRLSGYLFCLRVFLALLHSVV